MLETITATRFHKRMTTGRTGPFLLECEDGQQNPLEVVAKFTGPQLPPEGLIREALCAMLAADLQLPVPACHCVALPADFLAALAATHAVEAAVLSAAIPLGFGSTKLPPGYAAWMPGRSIPKAMQAEAAEIYAFDLLVQNPDRRPTNPNLQSKGERFAIFDHEMALVTQGVLFWQPPWVSGSLSAAGTAAAHVLWSGLHRSTPDLSRLLGAWESIDDARIAAYGAAIPTEWIPAAATRQTLDHTLGFLRDLRQNLRPAMHEIMRTLA
jgi:hypothetical protein